MWNRKIWKMSLHGVRNCRGMSISICTWIVGFIEDLRRFSGLSAISWLGSRRWPISENSSGVAGNQTPGPLAPQAKSLTTRPSLLQYMYLETDLYPKFTSLGKCYLIYDLHSDFLAWPLRYDLGSRSWHDLRSWTTKFKIQHDSKELRPWHKFWPCALWPWLKVMAHPFNIDNKCLKYPPDLKKG